MRRLNVVSWTVSCAYMRLIDGVLRFRPGLESAAFPGQSQAEIDRLLHVVVVGGGPTGVELRYVLEQLTAFRMLIDMQWRDPRLPGGTNFVFWISLLTHDIPFRRISGHGTLSSRTTSAYRWSRPFPPCSHHSASS